MTVAAIVRIVESIGLVVLLVAGSATAVGATRRHYEGTETPAWKRWATAASCIGVVVLVAGGLYLLAWFHS